MRYFAGLDVSLEETAICVVDENGILVKEVRAGQRTGGDHRGFARSRPTPRTYRPGSVLVDGVAA